MDKIVTRLVVLLVCLYIQKHMFMYMQYGDGISTHGYACQYPSLFSVPFRPMSLLKNVLVIRTTAVYCVI